MLMRVTLPILHKLKWDSRLQEAFLTFSTHEHTPEMPKSGYPISKIA